MSLPRLNTGDVKYLAFEGGGGAGNAFLGAIDALRDPRVNILRYQDLRPVHIRGFSGASAGAITALFLSLGYDHEEIQHITMTQDFESFFDNPKVGLVPRVGGCRKVPVQEIDIEVARLIELWLRLILPTNPPILIPTGLPPSELVELIRLMSSLRDRLRSETALLVKAMLLAVLVAVFKEHLPTAAYRIITGNLRQVVLSIEQDFGVFPGCVVREFFQKWIAVARWRVAHLSDYRSLEGEKGKTGALDEVGRRYQRSSQVRSLGNATFAELEREFQVKLALTGTNIETFKSHIFAASTTPNFQVADAGRISMSIPGAFKPFVLKDDKEVSLVKGSGEPLREVNELTGQVEEHFLRGVWVDGGLFDNMPLHVFDNEPGSNPKTLGLRLNLEVRTNIQTLTDFLKVWPLKMAGGTGEAQISRTRENYEQAVVLDTHPLGLFDFRPSSSVLKSVQQRARNFTLRYFGFK